MSETATWQPSASIPNLLKRAAIMAEIRRFFADRGVLEVETPCMSQATVTDIHLFPFETRFVGPGHSQDQPLFNDQSGIPYETPAGGRVRPGFPAMPQFP